nr:unnamed protein product [Callosobruchus analis]
MDCNGLSKEDMLRIRQTFYKQPDKITQDNILASYMVIQKPKRKRSRKENGKSHKFTVNYFIFTACTKKQVCQKLFRGLFSVSQRRINTICQKIITGSGISEQRGGDRKSHKSISKFNEVKNFISSLKGQESHYSRSKSRRIYLSAEYSISKLWNFYNEKVSDDKKNYKYFSRIFNNNFNIGFGSPATDTCNFCVRTATQINNARSLSDKSQWQTQLKVHKVRASQFYKIMKEEQPNTISLCFDLQQVQVLPKVPIQDAFYAQQLSFYFFCITATNGKNPVFYSWMKNQAGRGATEISSALLDFLQKTNFAPDIHTLRLFCDGCGGQNKNSCTIHMLMLSWASFEGGKGGQLPPLEVAKYILDCL